LVREARGESPSNAHAGRDLICLAIADRRCIGFSYEGQPRVVEPHVCGRYGRGHDVLLAWLIRGYSQSGPSEGWRNYLLDKMFGVILMDARFDANHDDYNPSALGLSAVYCQVDV
jgi:hypothetical protein